MRLRSSIAVLAIAAIVCAAFVVATPIAVCVMLVVLVAPVVVRPLAREVVRCDDQPVALLSLVLFRAPPRAACA